MKKIIFLTIVLIGCSLSVNADEMTISADEKKDCSNMKKISKAYIACKSENFKTSFKKNNIAETGTKITKSMVTKVKNFGKKVNNPFKKNK